MTRNELPEPTTNFSHVNTSTRTVLSSHPQSIRPNVSLTGGAPLCSINEGKKQIRQLPAGEGYAATRTTHGGEDRKNRSLSDRDRLRVALDDPGRVVDERVAAPDQVRRVDVRPHLVQKRDPLDVGRVGVVGRPEGLSVKLCGENETNRDRSQKMTRRARTVYEELTGSAIPVKPCS